eukprot:587685-Prymnesium_polylepis.1
MRAASSVNSMISVGSLIDFTLTRRCFDESSASGPVMHEDSFATTPRPCQCGRQGQERAVAAKVVDV